MIVVAGESLTGLMAGTRGQGPCQTRRRTVQCRPHDCPARPRRAGPPGNAVHIAAAPEPRSDV